MKKDLAIIFGLFILVGGLLVYTGRGGNPFFTNTGQEASRQASNPNMTIVNINTLTVEGEVADLANERKKGLSNRESLDINKGILFVFEKSGAYGIWMKDMKFAIDIIWLDENRKVVDVATYAAPEPGDKDDELTVYKPRSEAKYILEINAGLVDANNIQAGDTASFEL